MKKILVSLFVLLLAVLLLPGAASAAEIVDSGKCGDNVTWTLDEEGTLIISGKGKIEDNAFYQNYDICSVHIETGVTGIGERAFWWCERLTSVEMPDSITSIGKYAFFRCFALSDVVLSNNLTSISDYAFAYCDLNSVKIPDGVTTIESFGFACNYNLDSVVIPDTVISIGGSAFAQSSLANVEIPDSVISIGKGAFSGCKELTKIEIPASVESIGEIAFAYNEALSEIHFQGNAPSLGQNCFEEVVATAYYPAANGSWTQKVAQNYGGKITWVAVASACTHLKTKSANAKDATCTDTGYTADTVCVDCGAIVTAGQPIPAKGHVYTNGTCTTCGEADPYSEKCGENVTWTLDKKGTLVISGTGDMWDYSFENTPPFYKNINNVFSVVIGDGITSIGEWAFARCSNLTSVIIPDSITSIGDRAFYGCARLNNIVIPNNVTSIGMAAFSECTSLTRVVIPDSVSEIGGGAFGHCSSLSSVAISNGITSLDEGVFWYCTSLTSVVIPDGVTSIGNLAFHECDALTSVVIPASVTRIEEGAFWYCTELRKIEIPASVTNIERRVFSDCNLLTEIHFYGDAPGIGEDCFKGVTATVYYPSNNKTWTKNVMQSYGGKITWLAEHVECTHSETTIEGAKEATCTEDGYTGDTICAICDKRLTDGESIPTISHQEEAITAVAPTCTETGLTEGKMCTVCGAITQEQETVPEDGHSYKDGKCTVCGEADPDWYYYFKTDSYSFENYGNSISKKYFTTFYGPHKGSLLYKEYEDIGLNGLCFGMAYTTAAIYNGLPDCTTIDCFGTLCESIREIANGINYIKEDTESKLTIGKNTISIDDYIKYAFIYQLSSEVSESSDQTWYDIQGLYDAVKEYTDANKVGVTIGLTHYELDANGHRVKDQNGNYITSGHRVLAVGYEGRDILIDDPNNTQKLERLTINEDYTWSYSGSWEADGVNYINSVTRYQVDYYRPYEILLTGEIITTNRVKSVEQPLQETYIEGMDTVDSDSMLLFLDCENIAGLPDNLLGIVTDYSTVNADNGGKPESLSWVKDSHQFAASEITGQNNEIIMAGNDVSISVNLDNATDFIGNVEESAASVQFSGVADEVCTITYTTTNNGTEIAVVITGKVAQEAVQASQIEGGLAVAGISDVTVRLLEDDMEIASKDYADADFEIIYSDNGWEDWFVSDDKVDTTRLAGSHRFETAFLAADQMKANLGIEKFDVVVVASGMDFADALSGSYLAAVNNAPILLACQVEKYNNEVKAYIQENLNQGGKIYILGGENAVPASFETGLESFTVERLAGSNRFETNLLVLEKAGVGDKPILVSTGLNFADSLSASAAKLPILLVYGDKLLDSQITFLEANQGKNICILGGTGAVSEKLEAQLKTLGTVERLAGANRFETSVMIAEKFFANPESAVLAYAWNFPDGLCGGPLAATMGAPLILTMEKYETQAASYIQGQSIKTGIILGGEKLIPNASVNTIFGVK